MFIAKNQAGDLVKAWEAEAGLYYCPACNQRLQFRHGTVKLPHFAHVKLSAECANWTENESEQHLGLKKALYDWLETDGEQVKMEEYLSELEQRPDLLVNDSLAIEVQCSRLSLERLRARTENYQKHGYHVLWLLGRDLWLGEKLLALQRDLVYFSQNSGFHLWELDLENQEIRLKSLIHQSLRGKLAYFMQTFPFAKGRLLSILQSPFAAQGLKSISVSPDRNFKYYLEQQLYYKNPYWLKLQEVYYQQGRNLLTENIDCPHWAPLGLNFLADRVHKKSGQSFCQLTVSPDLYYKNFKGYYELHGQERLYPPAFYVQIDA